MEKEEEKLLVAWVNSLGYELPHCALVDSYADLLDGLAISEIIGLKLDETKKKRTLSASIEYLGQKFGWSSLPAFLSRRDACDMIALGEYRGMRDLLRFLRRMYKGKDDQDSDEEDRQHYGISTQESLRVSKYHEQQQQKQVVRPSRRPRKSSRRRTLRGKSSYSSSNRQRPHRKLSVSSSLNYRREKSTQQHRQRHLDEQKPQWNASTSMTKKTSFSKSFSKKCSTSSGGVFRMNDMIDPTYIPRPPSPLVETKKKKKKKRERKKKRFPPQILSPIPRASAPITSIERPVYPSKTLTSEQMETLEWISRWTQQDINSWKEISASFKDGILLCEIVEDVFKVRVVPAFAEPLGAFESIRNIKVALDAMRQCGVISKWLYSAEAIERGAYPEPLLGVLHDLRKSVFEEERKIHPHVSIRPSNLQNERVKHVLRWIRSLGLDMELLGIVDDENLRRTYRAHHKQGNEHTYLDDSVRNGFLLHALASVLVPSARLEAPYRKPRSVEECEINLSVALQTLQSASLLDKDLDIQAIAFAMAYGQGDVYGTGEGRDGMAFELLNHLYDSVNAKSLSSGEDIEHDENYNEDADNDVDGEMSTVIDDSKIMTWLDKIGFARFSSSNTNEEYVLPTLSCLIREHLGDGVLLCRLASVCSGQIIKPAVSHVCSESAAVSNIRLAIQHLQKQPEMTNQRSLHPLETICELLHCGSLNTWRKLLTSMRHLYEKIVGRGKEEEEEEEEVMVEGKNVHRNEEDENEGNRQLHLNDLMGHRRQQKNIDDEMDLLQDMKVSSNRRKSASDQDHIKVLSSWLSSLGIVLRRPLDDDVLTEFTDGTILCKLCAILDHSTGREGLYGIEEHPRSGAAKLNNIRKALDVFRKRKNFPLDYLWSEMRIREGDSKVICGLLMHCRKAYGHHLMRNTKKKTMKKSTGIVKPGFMKRRRMSNKSKTKMSKTSSSIRWRR